VPKHDTDCFVFAGIAEDFRQARVHGCRYGVLLAAIECRDTGLIGSRMMP